ncbi:MAG: DUF349 domain-containing protein [Prolixibacteraceae bacterium]|nr:DUF349 domain-containing protein [Prolixibacteraceae bacterium]MBN2775398.1 DUF349 domain-containing protein [Prolixibacteraceae bacterium]
MDPNDLKNSEEFMSNLPDEPKQREDAVESNGQPAEKTGNEKNSGQENKTPDKSQTIKTAKPPGKLKKKTVEELKEKPIEEYAGEEKSEEVKVIDEVPIEPEILSEDENKKTKAKLNVVEPEEKLVAEKENKPKKPLKEKQTEVKPVEISEVKTEEEQEESKVSQVVSEENVEHEAVTVSEKTEVETEQSTTEEHIDEITENEIASDSVVEDDISENKTTTVPKAEKVTPESLKKEEKVQEQDYANLSQVELINTLRDLLDKNEGQDIKRNIEAIKSQFYKLLIKEKEDSKEEFIAGGGIEEEYIEEKSPYEQDIKDLLKRYRYLKIELNKKLEVVKEDNLKLKYDVIEEIKNLINREESINKTFQEFRDLQNKWREIGLVPQSKMKDLWDTYHFHVENFYNYIKINKELRDLDLKKNLELKIKLCERAEELLLEPSIIKAFNTLQKLHERWRETGPVPHDKKDEIWERFKSATSKINKKHQEFFESRKSEQKTNLTAKATLCEKAEDIANSEIVSHRDWDLRSKELVELQKVWRTIGFAPKRDNNRIYERFRIACDKFFDKRREFYSKNKEIQQENLQMKIDLCVQAESLKESNDWKKATQDFIDIQKKWKEIGPVPRKHSDQVWKRFRDACDFFFNMKSKHFSDVDGEQVDNLKLKEELIIEVENFKPSKDIDANLKQLKEFQRRWTEIGHVPIKQKDIVQNKFRNAINKHFDDLKLDDSKRDILKFKNKVSSITETSRGKNKMRLERDKYLNQLKQLESDLVLLDNNIGFFAKSKNAEALIADVEKKIERTKEKIELLKKKITIIDEYDNE